MNNNCIVCLRDGVVTPAVIDNRLCRACFDAALLAVFAEDRRTKTEAPPRLTAERRERRVRKAAKA